MSNKYIYFCVILSTTVVVFIYFFNSQTIKREHCSWSPLDDSKKYVWTFWHSGEQNMPDFMRLNVQTWKSKLGEDWQINILERTPRGCNHYFKFLSREDLPVNFNKLGKRKKSDCLRLALLKRHGGIWIDTSILLIQHLDSFVQFENSQPKNLAGFYLRAYGSEKYNYTDFFESWFIAANKNSPLLERWQQIFNEYQSTAWKDDEKIKIQDHYLFNNLDLSNFVRYGNDFRDYLSIHVAFRKAIEENPEYFYNNVSLKEADSSAYFIPSFIEAWDGKQIQEILLSKSYEKDNKDFLTEILKQPLLKFNSGIYSQINKLNRSQLLDKGTIIGKLYSQLLHGQF